MELTSEALAKAISLAAALASLSLELANEVARIAAQSGKSEADIMQALNTLIDENNALAEAHKEEYQRLIAARKTDTLPIS